MTQAMTRAELRAQIIEEMTDGTRPEKAERAKALVALVFDEVMAGLDAAKTISASLERIATVLERQALLAENSPRRQ